MNRDREEETGALRKPSTQAREDGWSRPAETPTVAREEVHVWRADLDAALARMEEYESTLDEDERARAARFFFPKDSLRFVLSHGILRAILGGYLGVEAGRVRFSYGRFGKPSLAAGRAGEADLRFNMSVSGGLALYAVGSSREVGVDVERIRSDFPFDEIAGRFFTRDEVKALRAVGDNRRHDAFFRCWSRKEAFIKGLSLGLSLPLDSFSVSVEPGAGPVALALAEASATGADWTLLGLDAAPGYAAAVAVEGSGWRLERFDWIR